MRWRFILTIVPLFVLAAATAADPSSKPPVAKKVPYEVRVHGDTLIDNYFWLREKGSKDVTEYLQAENAYADAVTRRLKPFEDALYKEMIGRIKQTDLSVPYKLRGYRYYSRTQEGKQYPIRCRRADKPDAEEEVLLDGNEMAKGHKYFHAGGAKVSDNDHLLAYTTDTTGFREYHLFVKDLTSGKLLPDRVGKVRDYEWAADNRTLFYVTEDDAKRPYRLYRHTLGGDKDELIYEEKDGLYEVSADRSHDRKYLFLVSASSTTTEARYLPADKPGGRFTVLLPREEEHEYEVEHRDGKFYIRTNKDAKNFKLVTAPVSDPKAWTELVPHRPGVMLEGMTLFARHAVFEEREGGLPHLAVRDLATGETRRVSTPEPVYDLSPAENPEYDTAKFRFRYESLVTPPSVCEYDLASHERQLLKREEVLGGYDPAKYQSERVFAKTKDGVEVPISLVYRKGLKRDGTAPMWLSGYGAYGAPSSSDFSGENITLMDRGVVVAVAHVRGGGEMGKPWHDAGKMMNKRNTFTDFIACADYLVAGKYTSHDRIAIEGGSAGGLLIGAVVNMRPGLCKVAYLNVPFVDVINTMLDESLPLTTQEFIEWGNPKIKKEYDYLKGYCPYTNLAAKDYPAVLVKTSFNDSQVMYWEPAKYVAKLRSLKTDANPLVFKINLDAGHGGASGRYDAIRERAFVLAFVLDQLGIER